MVARFREFMGEPAETKALRSFYAVSAAALTSIHEEGGPPAAREPWQRLLADPKDSLALLSLSGLSAGSDALNEAWHNWLKWPGQ